MNLRMIVLAAAVALAAPAQAAPAARSFDLVTYAAPDGFTVQDAGDHVVILRQGTKSYCIIAIFSAQDAAGDLDQSFAAAWKSIALRAVDPVAVPATQHAQIAGGDAVAGGAMTTAKGTPVLVMLTTIDAGAKTVSVLVMTPGPDDLKVYTPSIQALLTSLAIKRVDAAPAAPAAPSGSADAGGPPDQLLPPTRQLTVADLVGEWKHGGNSIKSYVNASTGGYAGYGSISADQTWTIDAKGVLTDDYNGVSSGNFGTYQHTSKTQKKITLKPDGELILTPKPGEDIVSIYIVRGWRVTPELTLLAIVGPWYENDPPTYEEIHDPNKAGNLYQIWVRATKPAKGK